MLNCLIWVSLPSRAGTRCGVSSAPTACLPRNIRRSNRGRGRSTWPPRSKRRCSEKRKLIVEAGTGTGKTLAYLVPALLSERRVVVSTGTKALQEQLFFRDIPFLESVFDRPLRVCYMKGRSNYACRQKIYEAENSPVLTGLEEVADFQIIQDWEKTTEIGDRAEIRTLPENSTAWGKIDARSELCAGSKCKQYERCFITLMHQRAAEADIIIVNHHLFFADLAVRRDEMAQILPDYNAVIFDEAHEIEDIAGQYFGFAVSTYRVQDLRRDIAAMSRMRKFGSEELDRILIRLEEISLHFFGLLARRRRPREFHRPRRVSRTASAKSISDLLTAFDLLASHLKLIHDAPQEVIPLFRRAHEMRARDPVPDRRAIIRASCTGLSAAAAAFSCRPRRSTWPMCCASTSGTRWMRRC